MAWGLEVHEIPESREGQKTRLEPGNVVTIEPGIYIGEIGGIRIEEMLRCMPIGRSTDPHPRDLIEI